MQLNENEEKIIKDLFKKVTQYYKEYMSIPDDGDIPNQHCVDDIAAAFRIICQIVESFLIGYKQLQHQHILLEKKLVEAESEIRNHIRIQQEIKVWGDSLQDEIITLQQNLKRQKVKVMTLERELSQQKNYKNPCTSQERLPTETTTQDRQEKMLSLLSSQKSRQIQGQGFKKKNIQLQYFEDKQNKSFTHLAQQFLNSSLSKTLRSGIVTQKKKKTTIKQAKTNQVNLKIRNQRCHSQQERVKTLHDQSFYY
ncbi:unnamed protein product [Paramecium sonneborni]|uniref:Uncharacterized protein n=1 Tax=Paramecium sonneborni TaxID=65129 RepID=A0A8S1L8J3_9CILI|nr:unnamed protein product [Paramecium sonneborni]